VKTKTLYIVGCVLVADSVNPADIAARIGTELQSLESRTRCAEGSIAVVPDGGVLLEAAAPDVSDLEWLIGAADDVAQWGPAERETYGAQ